MHYYKSIWTKWLADDWQIVCISWKLKISLLNNSSKFQTYLTLKITMNFCSPKLFHFVCFHQSGNFWCIFENEVNFVKWLLPDSKVAIYYHKYFRKLLIPDPLLHIVAIARTDSKPKKVDWIGHICQIKV